MLLTGTVRPTDISQMSSGYLTSRTTFNYGHDTQGAVSASCLTLRFSRAHDAAGKMSQTFTRRLQPIVRQRRLDLCETLGHA